MVEPNSENSALAALETLVDEVALLQTKLIIIVGSANKTTLLNEFARRHDNQRFNLGVQLGHRLALIPPSDRGFAIADLLRSVGAAHTSGSPLLLDNLEVLFEPSLKINPLNIIKSLAHSRLVIAVWPGESRNGRLIYAAMGHPEHREFTGDGAVIFEIAKGLKWLEGQ